MDLLKVDGHAGLARDAQSGAIININKREAEAARERRKKKLEAKTKKEMLEQQVNTLQSEVSDIKVMLTKILEKL